MALLVIAAAVFGYAMYRWHERPRETWKHLTKVVEAFVRQNLAPAPSPAPVTTKPEATPAPTRPDPIAWLIEHQERWPKEVILREPMEFPAVSGGKAVGSLIVPAGATVEVTEITKQDIGAKFMGGGRRLPIPATDLNVRAAATLAKVEVEPKQTGGIAAATAPAFGRKEVEQPETVREATRDEIQTGLGALYTHGATTFRVFAPTAKSVSVVLYEQASGNEGRTVGPLRQESNNLWNTTVRGDLSGKFYTYLLDENDPKRAREVLDPYATNAVASSRGRITPMTTVVRRGANLDSATDAIIYEMHVRDFTIASNSGVKNPGLYLGFAEQGTHVPNDQQIKTVLDHLVELGVTHVELMPVQDFDNDESAGGYNWGYITSDFFSPEGMFATNPNDDSRVRELKTLISALHGRGIAVIMDVVYNHTAASSSLMSIAPECWQMDRAAATNFAVKRRWAGA